MEQTQRSILNIEVLRKQVRNLAKTFQKRPAEPEPEKKEEVLVRQLCERFLQDKRDRVKRSTCSTYTNTIEKHILPIIGDLPVSALTVDIVRNVVRQAGEDNPNDPLAPSTIRGLISVLRGLLLFAQQEGMSVPAPYALHRPPKAIPEIPIFEAEDYEKLRRYCEKDINGEKLGILICMFTGLRLGELCALKWGDITMEKDELRVRRTIQRIRGSESSRESGKKTQVIFDTPKSLTSCRNIPMPLNLVEYMRPQRKDDDCYVLTGVPGSYLEPRTYQNHYKKMLKEAGVKYVNFHALRHTFATTCIDKDFDPKILSEVLGHADVSLTLNTYVHPSLPKKKQYMQRIV